MRRAIAVHRRGDWPEGSAVDAVTLAYLDRHRRRTRLVAASGQTYLLDLPRASHLVEGSGLELDGGGYLHVHAAAEPLFETVTADHTDLVRIAWHLGNRHLPVQITGERLRVRADHIVADMVTGLGARITRLEAPFDPETGAYAAGLHHDGDH